MEAAKIVWKLATASPPILLCSQCNIPFNPRSHTLCPSGFVSPDKSDQIDDGDESKMPHIIAYATPIVYRNHDGHVAYKGQVFV